MATSSRTARIPFIGISWLGDLRGVIRKLDCSDEHEWFQKACQDPDGKYGKYFYIEDWHEGEPLPCNWRSAFGGSVWSKLPGHDDKVYLHIFHKKKPDLNWENPEVRQEIYKMINWWLDKGLAGFHVDAIINIKKKLPYQNYPADRVDGIGFMCNIIENHDESRGVSRYLPPEGRNLAGKKMLGGLNFMLRGLPFIYQGQEIGMENFQ